MKNLVFLAAVVVVVSATNTNTFKDEKTDRTQVDERLVNQIKVLEFFDSTTITPMDYTEQTGSKNLIERTNSNTIKNFNLLKMKDLFQVDCIDKYLTCMRKGLTPFTKSFTLTVENQRREVTALFELMYFAKDFETFHTIAVWARHHSNRDLLLYTYTLALLLREDCHVLIIPPLYEIYPYKFLGFDVVQKIKNLKDIVHTNTPVNPLYMKELGVLSKDNFIIVEDHFKNHFHVKDMERKLTYFTHDIGLNSLFYYHKMAYPFWMDGRKYNLKREKLGEATYFINQQILARYYMERLSNGLGEVDGFSWTQPVKQGFSPNMVDRYGNILAARPYDYNMKNEMNIYHLQTIKDYERRIRDAIVKGSVTMYDGKTLTFTKPEDFDTLVRFMIGCKELGDIRYNNYYQIISKMVLGGSLMTKTHDHIATVLDDNMMCMRDPVFYMFTQRLLHYMNMFNKMLPRYTKQELFFDGVTVHDVRHTELKTFFEKYVFDASNMIHYSKEELTSQKADTTFLAVHKRLNHKPFTFEIDIKSDKVIDARVKIFLGPKYDTFGEMIEVNENRKNMFLLDTFETKLKVGENKIVRKNTDFTVFNTDEISTRILKKDLQTTFKNFIKFKYHHNKMPLRLALPKGTVGGIDYLLYVVVNPVKINKANISPDVNSMVTDGHTLNFPFDRRINEGEFFTQNMFMKTVKIYFNHIRDRTDFDRQTIFNKVDTLKNTKNRDVNFNIHDINTNIRDMHTLDFDTTDKLKNRDTLDTMDVDKMHNMDTINVHTLNKMDNKNRMDGLNTMFNNDQDMNTDWNTKSRKLDTTDDGYTVVRGRFNDRFNNRY